MKEKYDTDANTAQTYADELVTSNIVGFSNYRNLQMDYENWCAEHGYRASSINVLRRSIDDKDYARRTVRESDNGRTHKMYIRGNHQYTDMVHLQKDRLGLYDLRDGANEIDQMPEDEQTSLLKDF